MDKRTEILAKAHLLDSNELAKEYYVESGLSFTDIDDNDYELLSDMVQKEIDILLADKSYQMIEGLCISKIKTTKKYVSLRIRGSYFGDREGITFFKDDAASMEVAEIETPVTFCCSMSGCNRIPFITGFVKWVDRLGSK